MKILALDLGTRMGWAMAADGKIQSGTESFSPGKNQGPGARFLKFRGWLADIKRCAGDGFDIVAYEDVKNHAGTDAAHIYGGFLAHLQAWAEHHQIELRPFGVGTIKKFATGKGNATKDEMVQAAKDAGYHPRDDNEADAIAILRLTIRYRAKAAADAEKAIEKAAKRIPANDYTDEEVLRVRAVLLPTWQSVQAIAVHAGIPHRRTLEILRERAKDLNIERRDARLDGHNPVWMVKLLPNPQGGLL